MFSYQFYKLLHLSSLFIMVLTTGLLLASVFGAEFKSGFRKKLSAIHGITLVVAFVAGFGLLAKLKIPGVWGLGWIWVKLIAWLAFGMLPLFLKRAPQGLKSKLPLALGLICVVAVYIILNKPF